MNQNLPPAGDPYWVHRAITSVQAFGLDEYTHANVRRIIGMWRWRHMLTLPQVAQVLRRLVACRSPRDLPDGPSGHPEWVHRAIRTIKAWELPEPTEETVRGLLDTCYWRSKLTGEQVTAMVGYFVPAGPHAPDPVNVHPGDELMPARARCSCGGHLVWRRRLEPQPGQPAFGWVHTIGGES